MSSQRAGSIEDFLRYVRVERRLSAHTEAAYRRDLADFAAFLMAVYVVRWLFG